MKVVILAGGMGSRISEETVSKPKPMVEIGGRPILWHIMKHYAHYGFTDFIICLGYKGGVIKRYFADELALAGDITVDFDAGTVTAHGGPEHAWNVTLVDTGGRTETGGRLLRIRDHLSPVEPFMLTYGDGVCDVDLSALLAFHNTSGTLATVTAVHPLARFGHIELQGTRVTEFHEKPQMAEGWINGGFFVLDPAALGYIPGNVDWAREPLEGLAGAGQLSGYKHEGFWQCMDTFRDKLYLDSLWDTGKAAWKSW